MNIRDTILIVDDMELNRAILRSVFEREYNLLEAENGEQAIVLLEQYHASIAVMLLDLVMPVKNGYQVMEEIGVRGYLSEVPVVVITAEDSVESEVQVFDLGASDIIMKPFEPHVVNRRVHNIIELNRHKLNQQELIEEQAAKLRESNEVMIDALSSIIEYRSVETGQHIQRIRMFTRVLLEEVAKCYTEFGLDDHKINIIASASSMHDIGKIAIPDSILNKPGRLTKEEMDIMKTHTVKGCEMLAGLNRMSDREYLQYAYNICRYHHERWDGGGYPDGLKGDSIPVCAQVVGIADCYDALTTDRVYKKAIVPERAFNMILNGECGTFSPKLLECFKNVKDAFEHLTHEYSDGNMPKAELVTPDIPVVEQHDGMLDTLQLGQAKYFTMLRYTNATAMEVDLRTGLYHVVYMGSNNFSALKSGNSFEEAIRNFAEEAVYPEDREEALKPLGSYMEDFFADGLMKRSQRYRVYNQNTRTYGWCEATLLRVDTGNPHQRKVMLIWKETGAVPNSPVAMDVSNVHEDRLAELLGGVLQRLNDQWFTIVRINDGFRNLLGYEEEEIRDRFHNRFMNIIHWADRDSVIHQVKEQQKKGNTVELEYRVTGKNGKLIWLLDKGQMITAADGREYFYSVLIDISQSKKDQEELRLTLERHKIIMEHTNDIIFEWNIKTDQLSCSANWEKKFGYTPISNNASQMILLASHVHPEDFGQVSKMVKDMISGVPYEEMEIRLADAKGRYRWCKVRAAAQYNDLGKSFKAVGIIADIDDEKKESQQLKEKAARDELTKLYNRSAARDQIEDYLDMRLPEEKAAMLIVDVDDFKLINDNYGHLFGDVVLQQIASGLRGLFRSGDIIARIGGDEFLIFMQRIPDLDIVKERARRVADAVKNIFEQNVSQCHPSCSIGISFCPQDGMDFETLFKNSDIALYGAKSQGKNQFLLYDKETMDRGFGMPQPQTAANTRIESNDNQDKLTSEIADKAFMILYEADDLEQAINQILRMIGEQFGVSRAYIFEDTDDGSSGVNTFEWCNEGIRSQRSELKCVAYDRMGEAYKDHFKESGIFYCSDITQLSLKEFQWLELLGVKSLLQCAIKNDGVFKGFVGFDDCMIRRMWTKEQINALTFTARLLSAFLLKKRAQDRVMATVNNLRMVLDNQNAWVYVMDPESYRLRFINAKARTLAPEAEAGMICYETFFGRTEPCENCPIRHKQPMEIYNERRRVWAVVNASDICWENESSCLLTCQDVTKYKENEGEERVLENRPVMGRSEEQKE